jgi:hypothetical protein
MNDPIASIVTRGRDSQEGRLLVSRNTVKFTASSFDNVQPRMPKDHGRW